MKKTNNFEPIGLLPAKVSIKPNMEWFTGKVRDAITIDLGVIDGPTIKQFRYVSEENPITSTGAQCTCTAPTLMEDVHEPFGKIVQVAYYPTKEGKIQQNLFLWSNGKKQLIKLMAHVRQ